jgi:5'-phosphate synthase pdxT subunit
MWRLASFPSRLPGRCRGETETDRDSMSLKIAVLALQGDFAKHVERLGVLGVDAFPARTGAEIESADGIVIPGGESTTITKLMSRYGIDKAIIDASAAKKPIFGTCAGMIVLAKSLVADSAEKGGQSTLNLMDIGVARNAYGRQVESFETTLTGCKLTIEGNTISTLEAVFIRAPIIENIGNGVTILATYDGKPVLVEQDHLMAASFHPEMTPDTAVHRYFLTKVQHAAARTEN